MSEIIKKYDNGHTEEGYMGATKWVGNNSHLHLYGSSLAKAIRDDIKAAGIKGVTVRSKTFSGGQEIVATFAFTDSDLVSYEDFRAKLCDWDLGDWIYFEDGSYVHQEEFMALKDADKKDSAYRYMYQRIIKNNALYDGCAKDEKGIFNKAFREKFSLVKAIIDSYNYDDSNGMVDYYDVNFYDFYEKKYREAA